MKKIILSLILTSINVCTYSQKIELGGELGFSNAKYEYRLNNTEAKISLGVFITSEYSFNNSFSVASKVGYISKGGNDLDFINQNFEAKFGYLSLYLSPRYYFLKREKFKIYFHLSPSYSILLNAKVNDINLIDSSETGKDDFAIQAGFGLKYFLVNEIILDFNLGFEQGFSKAFEVDAEQLHNQSIPYIGVGIRKQL